MNLPAIDPGFLVPASGAQALLPNTAGPSFASWLDEQLRATNAGIGEADQAVRRLAVGEPVNLHQVMVQLERAKLQLELVLQVRGKLLEAYQDLLRMQI